MGRVKPSKMTGKFFLRTDRKPDKNEKHTIYLDYTLGLNMPRQIQKYGFSIHHVLQKSILVFVRKNC